MKLIKNCLRIIFYLALFGVVLSVPILIFCKYPTKDYWDGIGGFGSYLTGVAAIFAAFKAVPEWIKIRRNKQREKAEEALVAAKRFINAVLHVTSPFSFRKSDSDPKDKTTELVLERQERVRLVSADAQKLFDISAEADLYLNDEQIAMIDRLKDIWNEVQSNFNIYVLNLNNDIRGPEAIEAWEKAFARGEIKKELSEWQIKLKNLMRAQRDSAR